MKAKPHKHKAKVVKTKKVSMGKKLPKRASKIYTRGRGLF